MVAHRDRLARSGFDLIRWMAEQNGGETVVLGDTDYSPQQAKVEWHQGELFPRVGFIVTNLSYLPKGIVRFYNGRGTAEQWIKEGKYALNWTRLSCHKFVANQVRLWLFVLTYNLGNFMRRLVLPEDMKHWTLTSLQTRLIKTGGRLVRHARRLVFQLAEVLVTREMLTGILERISRLRLAPG